jgi:hypothetical protein
LRSRNIAIGTGLLAASGQPRASNLHRGGLHMS